MKKSNIYTILTIATLLSFAAKSIAEEIPLFESKEPIELTLIADVVRLTEDKSEDPEYISASLIQYLPELKIQMFDIKVKARGNTRRLAGLCDFPPLKFNFKKGQVKNTVFAGQDKLKFVSQCRQESDFQQYVLEEYLLYQTYGILTDVSYKTRLVNITIRDHKMRVPDLKMTGFLIEDDDALAKRINVKVYDNKILNQDSCKEEDLDRLAMFQYMIGNTDWYVNTRHNTDLFYKKESSEIIPVPFDFDFAGIINTPYAAPSKEIPITAVKQRYFKGSCREAEAYNPTLELFNSKKEEIFALYHSFKYLPKSVIKKNLRYYAKFYKIINDPASVEASFYSVCNSPFRITRK